MSDLVQRLRDAEIGPFDAELMDEAADAIDRLTATAEAGRIQEVVIGNLRAEIDRLTRERDEWKEIADRASVATSAWIGKHERLRARWDEAYRLLNEFRPVTGTNEWVAVRLSALNHVLMGNSSTPLVGPLRGEK